MEWNPASPDAADALTDRLADLGRQPVDSSLVAQHLQMMAAESHADTPVRSSGRARAASTGWARMSTGWARTSSGWARMSTGWARKVQVAFAAVAALLFGGMGMAYAGVLPKAVQEVAHETLAKVGLTVPDKAADHPAPVCDTHGQCANPTREDGKANGKGKGKSEAVKPVTPPASTVDTAGDNADDPASAEDHSDTDHRRATPAVPAVPGVSPAIPAVPASATAKSDNGNHNGDGNVGATSNADHTGTSSDSGNHNGSTSGKKADDQPAASTTATTAPHGNGDNTGGSSKDGTGDSGSNQTTATTKAPEATSPTTVKSSDGSGKGGGGAAETTNSPAASVPTK